MTTVATTRAELAEARSALPGTVAVVMTMGALHEGHASLMRAARSRADSVIVTIFVNPLQFGPNEDFDRYPRTLETDLSICDKEQVDLVFAPSRQVMYPYGEPAVRVDPGPLAEVLEGASRPGHFAGALTVVLKLLHLTRPDLAYFGEKDYQQLTLIRAMVDDLDLPIEVVGVETVREPDGLALSSRNRYLSEADRRSATLLSRALTAAQAAARAAGQVGHAAGEAAAQVGRAAGEAAAQVAGGVEGEGTTRAAAAQGAAEALRAASAVVASDPAVRLEYLTLTDPALHPFDPATAGRVARLLVAARVGETRLIDNAALEIG